MSIRRARTFRAPLVSVIAAFAPALACDSTEPSASDEDVPEAGGEHSTPEAGVVHATCPVAQPTQGERCAGNLFCSYGPRACCPAAYPAGMVPTGCQWSPSVEDTIVHQATCVGGRIVIRSGPSSCNPPASFWDAGLDAGSSLHMDAEVRDAAIGTDGSVTAAANRSGFDASK